MSNATHSPGRWQAGLDLPLVDNNDPDKRLVWAGSLLIADCRSKWISSEQSEANARLMAAAPKLLEALKDALRQSNCDGDLCAYEWHEKARAAIAKATGETP